MNNEYNSTFTLRKKTAVFPSNPIHYCFYHKNPDILQLYTDSRYNKKKSTNKFS